MGIENTILSDPINQWLFSIKNNDIFLVGGYIRDILMCVISRDKDYILKDNVKDIAEESAKRFNGVFITLKTPTTYRVVLKNKEVLDFSTLKGSINEDLKSRDFTVNAIAWSPRRGIIDPFGGISDLKNHIIKAVRIENLSADPLRIIRAYRFAAELGFKIEKNTRKGLKRYTGGIDKVAGERITEEVFRILRNKDATTYLKECYKDNVLRKVFDINLERLAQNLKLLRKFDLFLKGLPKRFNKILEEETSQGLKRAGLIRLVLLLMNGGEDILKNTRLKVSRKIRKALRAIHKGYAIAREGTPSMERLFKIFKATEDNIFESAIALSIVKGYDAIDLLNRVERYLKIKNKTLLDGNDIQRILNISAGERIGKILLSLQERQFKSLIKTKAQAEQWLISNFT